MSSKLAHMGFADVDLWNGAPTGARDHLFLLERILVDPNLDQISLRLSVSGVVRRGCNTGRLRCGTW